MPGIPKKEKNKEKNKAWFGDAAVLSAQKYLEKDFQLGALKVNSDYRARFMLSDSTHPPLPSRLESQGSRGRSPLCKEARAPGSLLPFIWSLSSFVKEAHGPMVPSMCIFLKNLERVKLRRRHQKLSKRDEKRDKHKRWEAGAWPRGEGRPVASDFELETSEPSQPVLFKCRQSPRAPPRPPRPPASRFPASSADSTHRLLSHHLPPRAPGSGIWQRMICLIAGCVTFLKPIFMAEDLSKRAMSHECLASVYSYLTSPHAMLKKLLK